MSIASMIASHRASHGAPCHRCGRVPTPEAHGYGYVVACADCYDGAPDGCREIGMGATKAEALRDWSAVQELGSGAPC